MLHKFNNYLKKVSAYPLIKAKCQKTKPTNFQLTLTDVDRIFLWKETNWHLTSVSKDNVQEVTRQYVIDSSTVSCLHVLR